MLSSIPSTESRAPISPRHQIARGVIGYGISFSPDDLFYSTGEPKVGSLPAAVSEYIASAFTESRQKRQLLPVQNRDLTYAKGLLYKGIDDISQIFSFTCKNYGLDEPDVSHIGAQQETVMTIAHIAKRPGDDANRIIHDQFAYCLVPHLSAIALFNTDPADALKGCPEAGRQQTVIPTPLFKRFVSWSASLHALAANNELQQSAHPVH
jgi:hypothetical protein